MAKVANLKLIHELDQLISAMKIAEARSILANLWIETIPTDLRPRFAELCRRTGQNRLAIKIMHKLIHEERSSDPAHLLEYASCLRRVGLINEALRTLGRLVPATHPNSLLQMAFCHIHRWDYAEAAKVLLSALEHSLSEREQRLAKVNLVASLLELGRHQEASAWLAPLIEDCSRHSAHLYFNCREFSARVQLLSGNISQAIAQFEKLESEAKAQVGASRFAVAKWLAVARLQLDPQAKFVPELRDLRLFLRREAQWETLRGLDWEVAKWSKDEDLAAAVFFGTPYAGFRRQAVLTEIGLSLPKWVAKTDRRNPSGKTLTFINGLTGENIPFKFGSLHYRTMLMLLSDSYQPWTVDRIFDGLFGEEAFNPYTSPKRIYQLIERIRLQVRKANLPLELIATKFGFRMRPLNEGAVIINENMQFTSSDELILAAVRQVFHRRPFSVKDLSNVIPLSSHQRGRAVKRLLKAKVIERAAHRRYRIRAA